MQTARAAVDRGGARGDRAIGVRSRCVAVRLWRWLAGWFGRWQFERNLRYDAMAAQATPGAPDAARRLAIAEWFYRLPSLLWRDPLAAIVEKELRSLARTPRFRTVFIMGFTFGLVVWFPVVASQTRASASRRSWFLTVVCVYALTLLGQVSYWNCFGFDRSAAAFYFAAPAAAVARAGREEHRVADLHLPGSADGDRGDVGAAASAGWAAARSRRWS